MNNALTTVTGIAIAGAGDHGRVVCDILTRSGHASKICGFYDDNQSLHGDECLGIPVIGPLEELKGLDRDCRIAMGVSNIALRQRIYALATKSGMKLMPVVDPSACLSSDISLGEGVFIGAFVYIGVSSVLGSCSIINNHCSIDHDSRIGGFAELNPGVVCGGRVIIGDRAMIGMQATLRDGIEIGEDARVGMGAVVTKSVKPCDTVFGVPAATISLNIVR